MKAFGSNLRDPNLKKILKDIKTKQTSSASPRALLALTFTTSVTIYSQYNIIIINVTDDLASNAASVCRPSYCHFCSHNSMGVGI